MPASCCNSTNQRLGDKVMINLYSVTRFKRVTIVYICTLLELSREVINKNRRYIVVVFMVKLRIMCVVGHIGGETNNCAD